jgi:hypothetical protein
MRVVRNGWTVGKSVRQFEPKKAREGAPDDLDHLTVRETGRLTESGEPLSEEVREKLTELRTDFLRRQFEPGKNLGTDAFVELIQLEIDWVMTHLRSIPLLGSLLLATDKGASDDSRMRAYQEVLQLTHARIVPERWHLTDPQLKEMANDRRRSFAEEGASNIVSAVMLAIGEVDELTVDDVPAIGSMIRTRVNEIATEAVLGPRWRDYKNHFSLIEIRDGDKGESYAAAAESGLLKEIERHGTKLVAQINTSEIEAPIILRQMLKRAKLSLGEARAVAKMLKEDRELRAVDAKGTETSTGRVQKQRAINKMRKIKK